MNLDEVPSILEYYGCADIKALTNKMQSIVPFKTVQAHMNETHGGFKVDASVRYFTEDIPYGLLLIKAFAELTETPTPAIDDVINWAQNIMGKRYIHNGRLVEEIITIELPFLSKDNLRKLCQNL